MVNFPFPEGEDYVTLAGLVYKHLGHIPKLAIKWNWMEVVWR